MGNIPKTYANKVLKQYGTDYVNEEAREFFIKKIDEYANKLSKETDKALKIRNGKKIMLKDVELASQYM